MYIISHVRNTNLGNLMFVNCGCACEILAPPSVITNVEPLHQACLLRELPPLPLCDILARITLQSEEIWSTYALVMIHKACRNIHHTCAETAHYIHWLDVSCIYTYSESLPLLQSFIYDMLQALAEVKCTWNTVWSSCSCTLFLLILLSWRGLCSDLADIGICQLYQHHPVCLYSHH